ncbi:hypothetical protein GCM10010413_42060 [Promicromonospora sukumoe]|uniref:Uncharacterized protein n=1 Tax=Promicromonospora sukumoe TaxID=88382 RepID=A0A7W3JDZ7_9MICO|nr:hypothetical protein [Promicromonospora sukumoe]MBA8811088.1 hypothetical protein [Promicromonospora sukumoe]
MSAPTVRWERFLTLRTSLRYQANDGKADVTWELTPEIVELGDLTAFLVSGRLVILEENYEITNQISLIARRFENDADLPRGEEARRVAEVEANTLLWERSMQVAYASAGLAGVSISRRFDAPKPVIELDESVV